MAKAAFAHVETWVFDLDNTLYSHEHRLFDQIDKRMTAFISDALGVDPAEANTLRAQYWRDYGTTLNGLMRAHGMRPERFLEAVHDIDLSAVPEDPALGAALEDLPGRKIVHTNGSKAHGERIIDHLGIAGAFDAVYGIECAGFAPKPQKSAYQTIMTSDGLAPERAAMFEDTARNLAEPFAMGMRTVWTPTDCARASEGAEEAHVEFVAEDLTAFLASLR